VITLMLLLQATNLVTSPLLRYDKERYEYEDRLISGDLDFQDKYSEYVQPRNNWLREVESHPIVPQPLNYRLPQIPTKPPSFLGPSFLNLTAAPGTTVVLPCRVIDLGVASPSWIRKPQLTVLSSGPTLFSSSPRMKLIHFPESPDWTLQIGPLVKEDGGTYECQLNTEPKMSTVVQLNVVVGSRSSDGRVAGAALALQGEHGSQNLRKQKTEILAPDFMRIEEGGTATLECVVTEHEVAPPYFTWFLKGVPLDFSHHRGGILLQTEKKRKSSYSRLTITRMKQSDTGLYTCSPAGGENATIHIQVKEVQNRNFFFSSEDSGSVALFGRLNMIVCNVNLLNLIHHILH